MAFAHMDRQGSGDSDANSPDHPLGLSVDRPPVAQWIRATDFGSVGRGFESLRAGQISRTKVMPRHPFGTTPFRPYHSSYHSQVWIRRRFGSKAGSTRTARSSR